MYNFVSVIAVKNVNRENNIRHNLQEISAEEIHDRLLSYKAQGKFHFKNRFYTYILIISGSLLYLHLLCIPTI